MHFARDRQLTLELRIGGDLFFDQGAFLRGQISLYVIEKLFWAHEWATSIAMPDRAGKQSRRLFTLQARPESDAIGGSEALPKIRATSRSGGLQTAVCLGRRFVNRRSLRRVDAR